PVVSVDAWDFTERAERALAATASDRVPLADAALSLWNGEPYPDHDDLEPLLVEADRLAELRLAVVEARGAALLDLGQPEAAARGLTDVARAHPFRERLWGRLALAQYRSGRQAEALETLRTLRTGLADELGVDPSEEIRRLESDILTQSERLTASAPAVHSPAPTALHLPGSGLVGRADALAEVDGLLDDLIRGRSGRLVVSGEPGIGKSRVAAELVARAAARGVQVAIGRCHEADVAPPFWPWRAVLRQLAGSAPPPEVARLLGSGDGSDPVTDAGSAAFRTYDAVCELLRSASTSAPLLVVLEDVHWADASSLRLLGYAAEALADAPVALAVTRRAVGAPDADGGTQALAAALATLARTGARRVALHGLAGSEVGELLERALGTPDPSLAAVLTRRTEGNPFYLLELTRLLEARGTVDPADAAALPVPEGVRDVIRLRVGRMPAPARVLLDHGSVAGRQLDPDVLAEVTEMPLDAVLDGLDLCVASGLVTSDGARYQFTHALTREGVYAAVPSGRRLRMHATLATALRRRGDPELVTDLAHHARVAAVLGPDLADLAVVDLTAAARQAEDRHAFDEALPLWQQAVEAETLGRRGDPLRRYDLLRGTTAAQLRLADIDGARVSVDEAVAIAHDLGRWDLVAAAATSFAGQGAWSWRAFGVVDEAMIGTLEACLDHLEDDRDGALKALVLACLQMEHYFGFDAAVADEYGRRSVELARRTGDDEVLVAVLLLRALASWGSLTARDRVLLGEELLGLPVSGETEVHALWQYGAALYRTGRVAESDAVMERCFAAAARLRHTGADIPIAWWRFMRAVAQESPEAGALGDAALERHRRARFIAMDELTAMHLIRRAPVGTAVPEDAQRAIADNPSSVLRALVAHAVAESGDLDGAVALLGPPPDPRGRNYASRAGICLRVAVFALAADEAAVRDAVDRMTDLDRDPTEVVTYGSIDCLGSVDYFLALAARALGDEESARTHTRAALAFDRSIGNRAWGRRAAALAGELGIDADEIWPLPRQVGARKVGG
ncbi:MAG TPA: BTAD domain-containing putative transcriptional regulator, partial [Lapillicoccus sp.]|nr:BTAD domain-containing putative transcriptional regulator [Lapillicoccus sp.]